MRIVMAVLQRVDHLAKHLLRNTSVWTTICGLVDTYFALLVAQCCVKPSHHIFSVTVPPSSVRYAPIVRMHKGDCFCIVVHMCHPAGWIS